MSVDDYKKKFVNFAKASLLKYERNDADQEYCRSLVTCFEIFTGQPSDNSLMIEGYYPEYGAAILTTEIVLDPLILKVFVVGLDGWEFTVDANGRDNSLCDNGTAAFLSCGDLPKDKITVFLSQVYHELAKASSKRSSDRHASNADGGLQHTPGFLRAVCMKVLCAPQGSNVIFNNLVPPQMSPQCSGFTDVGMHTGCNQRDTILPLVLSVLKATLKNGMNPPLEIVDHCHTRFVIEYYLRLAAEVQEKTKQKVELLKSDINLSMHYLKVVSRYVSTQATWHLFWPDFLPMVEKECSSIRKHLEDVTSRQACVDSERFKITLPNFDDIQQSSSPTLLLDHVPEYKTSDECLDYVLEKSKTNLDWLPLPSIQSLYDCKQLLDDRMFTKLDAYTFSTVFVSIEMFLFQLAKDHLSESENKNGKSILDRITSKLNETFGSHRQSSWLLSEGDTDMLVEVCDKYIAKLHMFKESYHNGIGGLLSNELYSHEVLIGWLKFCLLFKTSCDHYSILAQFAVPLHYTDLEHLVLKDKWAWELLDLISGFLQRYSNGSGVVFSGRQNEINDMFKLADQFATAFPEEYNAWWTEEQNEAELRIQNRWNDIVRKKEECARLRAEISRLQCEIADTTLQRGLQNQYLDVEDGIFRRHHIVNPEWTLLNNKVVSLQSLLRSNEGYLEHAKKAPAYLKQPLPLDDHFGKRALFFVHMPPMLRATWSASFQAQEMIFSNGTNMTPPGGTCDFHSFYRGPVDYRQVKSVILTPLALFIPNPPASYGFQNVETIFVRNDGVWYQSGFNPSIVWSGKRNPFIAPRKDAVERFCEPTASHDLSWTVIQQGVETPKDRGNFAIAKLFQKPLSMHREQFLTLGNLRASPLHQLFHLLNSIKDMSLPCQDTFFQTTHTVVRQVLFHIGEIKECTSTKRLLKLCKWGMGHDETFMDMFRTVLVEAIDRVKEASKNENEFFIYLEIISFFSQFNSSYLELMDQCSAIACGWAERMEVEIQNARDKSQNEIISQIQERRHSFLLYALLSYEMLVISPEYFTDEKRICKIIELRLQINSSQPEHLSEKTKNILRRIYFFLSRIFPVFQEHPTLWNQTLTSAIKKVLPSYIDYEMQWISFDSSYCWWTQNKAGDYVSINIMNGIVLVNGSPPSLLSLSIRNNKLYRRVFGDTDFEVTVGRNGVHKTRNSIRDRYYSFQMNGSELVIFEEFEDKKLLLLDANASSSWCNHIPIGMTELYSHWLYLDKMIVLFRPVSFRERTIYYIVNHNGLYKVPRQFRENLTTLIDAVVSTFDKFLVLDQNTKSCLAFFSKFEREEYVHPYLTNEKSLKIFLVRFRIGFELNQHSKRYDCSDFSEYKLRSIQQFNDKMYKFYDYLILEKDSGEQVVIFPQGEVNVTNNIVSIKRPPAVVDEISLVAHRYNTFTVHNKFCHLQHKDLVSGLQLAAIQAATSSSLPEVGTCMTGYEMAIRQIRKCWVNYPLEKEEQTMLNSLLAVKDLPPTLVIISHQLMKNSFHLSFLHKDCPRVNLNLDSFTKALNEYNLSFQPHFYARNFRLSLKIDEKSMAGISRSESHFYSVKRQSNGFQESISKYKRKKAAIDSYEDELCSFKCEVKRKDIMEFPLKNLPSFNNKTLGNHIVDKLVRSHQHYSSLPHLIFHGRKKQGRVEEMLVKMHKSIELQGQELYSFILDRIFLEMPFSSSFESKTLLIEKAANEISCLTMCDLVEAVWQPSSLLGFNPSLSMQDINELFLMIVDWMQFCVLGSRIKQVRQHLQANETDRALLELSVRRNYDPYQYPKWLAFELDQGLQIRPDQATILDDILCKNGSVTQLNMGLGKTRVIVPCLILELSKRKKIPRVYLLSSLLDEGYDYLQLTLTGGVFSKKLFRFPFNRDVTLNPEQAILLTASLKYCESVEGAIVLAPEHTLSRFLKGFELSLRETVHNATNIPDANKFQFADIYDEVDEIMCPKQELIYAEGAPKALESGSRRWSIVFSLLYNLRHHSDLVSFLHEIEIADIESRSVSIDAFNGFRLRPGKRLENKNSSIIRKIAMSLFCNVKGIDFPEGTIDWMKKPLKSELKDRMVGFVTDCSQASDIVCVSDFYSPEHFQDMLMLRGLLAHGVLIHCLKLRHSVDYGIVPNHKTLMAIPFQAANLPKLRSEFAQPDIAII